MSDLTDGRALELLRGALPAAVDRRQTVDLWPDVQRRITRGAHQPRTADWILVVALVLLCLFRPSLAGLLLLHF
jgi:hypothetical protein